MADPFGASQNSQKKADGLADAINRLLQDFVIKCAREEGIRNLFHVSVIGYGSSVGPAFGGALAGRTHIPISDVGNTPLRIEQRIKKIPDGAGGLIDQPIRFPIWFDVLANGGTPMCQALNHASSLVQEWLTQHPNSFPPIVINITDGEATDGNPQHAADTIRNLSTTDGNVLLFNCHLSSNRSPSVEFPDDCSSLPDPFSQQLFNMSSPLTELMIAVLNKEGFSEASGRRGYTFNARMEQVIRFLDIGTRTSALR